MTAKGKVVFEKKTSGRARERQRSGCASWYTLQIAVIKNKVLLFILKNIIFFLKNRKKNYKYIILLID
jgi:hypothetical protein